MKVIPVLKSRNMQASLKFYVETLGFRLRKPDNGPALPVIDVTRDGIDIQLSTLSGDGVFGSAVNIEVEDVDGLFKTFVQRGLDATDKKDSPVHQGPVNQSWGTREFYVNDPDGNTLRFRQPIR